MSSSTVPIKDRVSQILNEIRVVLPGTQAILGFQLAAVFQTGFESLPSLLKYLHVGSLFCLTLSILFLLTPASYHRVAEEGEDTEHFYQFSALMVLLGMLWLAFGLSVETYVVIQKILKSEVASLLSSIGALLLFLFFWFGLSILHRKNDGH
jgi:hypothetical protein